LGGDEPADNDLTKITLPVAGPFYLLFLCLFFRSFFLRLWVAIFRSFRFLPQGTSALLYKVVLDTKGD